MRLWPVFLVLELRSDLLDAPNSDCMKEFFGSAAIVLVDNGGVSNSMCLGTLSSVAAANSIDFKGIESAEGRGNAASVQGDTGSTAFSVLHDFVIVDPIHCTIPSMHVSIVVT